MYVRWSSTACAHQSCFRSLPNRHGAQMDASLTNSSVQCRGHRWRCWPDTNTIEINQTSKQTNRQRNNQSNLQAIASTYVHCVIWQPAWRSTKASELPCATAFKPHGLHIQISGAWREVQLRKVLRQTSATPSCSGAKNCGRAYLMQPCLCACTFARTVASVCVCVRLRM